MDSRHILTPHNQPHSFKIKRRPVPAPPVLSCPTPHVLSSTPFEPFPSTSNPRLSYYPNPFDDENAIPRSVSEDSDISLPTSTSAGSSSNLQDDTPYRSPEMILDESFVCVAIDDDDENAYSSSSESDECGEGCTGNCGLAPGELDYATLSQLTQADEMLPGLLMPPWAQTPYVPPWSYVAFVKQQAQEAQRRDMEKMVERYQMAVADAILNRIRRMPSTSPPRILFMLEDRPYIPSPLSQELSWD